MEVLLPRIGMTMSEGTINAWMVKDGEKVTKGEPLFEVTTDKLNTPIDAPATGTLKIKVRAGEVAACGDVIAEIEE